MKRSKSSHPLVQKCSQILARQRSFVSGNERQKSVMSDFKLEKILMEAEESYEKADFEKALMKFNQGVQLKPKNETFALGVRKSRLAILNDIKNSGDSIQMLKDSLDVSDQKNIKETEFFMKNSGEQTMMNLPFKSENPENGDFKSETARKVYASFKEKSSEHLYNLKIHDGKKYKVVSATAQDLKEYLKDRDYFKMKEQNAKDWKKLRSEMNRKIAEKEAVERLEKEAKLLEEKTKTRHYCEEQVTLIGRYYQNGKLSDVIRFSENFIKYLNKKADKMLPRKWVYLATAFNYLGRAYVEQGNFEKAQTYGEKLYKVAVSSANTELLSQSYILSGKLYVKLGKFEEAATVWEKLVPLTENLEKKAWLFHEIGRCYFEMEKYDTSYKYGVESALFAQKSSSPKWICSANVLQGQSEMKRGNYSNALKKFQEARTYAEAINDENTLGYLDSVEELLTLATEKTNTEIQNNGDRTKDAENDSP